MGGGDGRGVGRDARPERQASPIHPVEVRTRRGADRFMGREDQIAAGKRFCRKAHVVHFTPRH